ncbi:MAG TPA: bifunctional DNA-formamidopyrimidine glycosylase/DNA-(apurinic or apyrimidinic site) lyase [Pseudomonadales bacterium]|jgi:formamidopyrimidine-DNA glycosylase|nr:bifunctional DNA-formamidopyrimidine glycosylase/DNA-(apurinic or apyrimidinic site) lyase [Pseudomonadales bacterium]
MPELPEVETTRRGIEPALVGRTISGWTLRQPRLRWPVVLPPSLRGQRIRSVVRRAKYLVVETESGSLIVHLGMSGSLRLTSAEVAPGPHDHVDFELEGGRVLRLTDPRRFGSIHFHEGDWREHWLIKDLGIEPFDNEFDGAFLHRAARKRRVAIKQMLMDARVVVGVGNIYANESLFRAGIRPRVAVSRISRERYSLLAQSVRDVLAQAIREGGTTLRDFVDESGRRGYFSHSLNVYGREDLPCYQCGAVLKGLRIGQRATVYCPNCQR